MTTSIVVLGTQWGDEGKGKIVDLLSREMDAVVRLIRTVYADLSIPADGPTDPRVKAALVYLQETSQIKNRAD